jgi:small subunit ribosomal protein S2
MTKQECQTMFENAVHVGHRAQKWNPKMKKFIYGERNGIHIINLEKTAEYLDRALEFLSKLASEGRTLLFVSTKPQSVKLLEGLAKECRMPYVISKWIPGLLTNFGTLKNRIKYLADLKEQEKNGEFDKYTKKEASNLRKIMEKLELALGGVQTLMDKPDAVFVVDAVRDHIVVEEANRLRIPVVSIVDTNADPAVIDYPIPGNDDAVKSLIYFFNKIKGALTSSSKAKK